MKKRWPVTFEAIDPGEPDHGMWEVGIAEWRLRLLRTRGHESKLAQLLLVRDILEPGGTERIYEGWSRPDKDDCFVYVGRPVRNRKSLTIETPAPKNMLFLAFVLPDGTIDDWSWRPCSVDDPTSPSGVTGTLLWPKNQI